MIIINMTNDVSMISENDFLITPKQFYFLTNIHEIILSIGDD
jgi:hypothetical protein